MPPRPSRLRNRTCNTGEAYYTTNEWWIVLPHEHNVYTRAGVFVGGDRPNDVGVLLHEYVHYLQNVATVAGWKWVRADLLRTAAFSQTVKEFGRPGGDALLNDSGRAALKEAKGLTRMWATDVLTHESAETIEVTGTNEDGLIRGRARVDGDNIDFEQRLSMPVIEESLAFEIERLCVRAGDSDAYAPPVDPYLVLNRLAEHAWPELSAEGLVRCGLAALQSDDPPRALVGYLNRREEPASSDVEATIASQLPRIMNEMSEVEAMFEGRGLATIGLASIFGEIRKFLRYRAANPFFELRLVEALRNGGNELIDFLSEFVPCEILFEFAGGEDDVGRDVILTFGDAGVDVEGRRGLQAVVHAMRAHLDDCELGFRDTVDAADRCPFYTVCELPRRRQAPDVCRSTPWATAATPERTCWYGSGVVGLSARVHASRVER